MKTVALVAHDQKKNERPEWVNDHREALRKYGLAGTGSTAERLNSIPGRRLHGAKRAERLGGWKVGKLGGYWVI